MHIQDFKPAKALYNTYKDLKNAKARDNTCRHKTKAQQYTEIFKNAKTHDNTPSDQTNAKAQYI